MSAPALREHAEWLSLVDVSGPFLSLTVLGRRLPNGLDPRDPEQARRLRLAYDEWREATSGPRPDTALHRAWFRHVLTDLLGHPAEVLVEEPQALTAIQVTVPEYGQTLTPTAALCDPAVPPAPRRPRVLCVLVPPGQALERPLADARWLASPVTRVIELLRRSGVRLGLLTNGEEWMLVDAPRGETSGFATWTAELWFEEPLTLRAFTTLLGPLRLFGVVEAATLEGLLSESANDEEEVTSTLGAQVRAAVEVLVQSLDRADRDRGGALFREVPEAEIYEAAVAVMMRLIFLLYAEERRLLPLDDPLWANDYAVSPLRGQLEEAAQQHGEEVLERRHDAWYRLLATFRAVHAGIEHDRLRLVGHGGDLFDPDRHPFLEGRLGGVWSDEPAVPVLVDDRTVLHLLSALQTLRVRVARGTETRRLSFRELDVEQIGHVYEGLLDHELHRSADAALGLKAGAGRDALVPLDELERRTGDELVDYLREATGRTPAALRRALSADPDGDLRARVLVACDNNQLLASHVAPYAALLDLDDSGMPRVVPPGSLHVGAGTTRRATGTHYTPPVLTEEVVRHALEPLVYEGPAEGVAPDAWRLHPAATILGLRVCDPAMGSGAFLVQACRYMADRLVEAWSNAEALLRARGETEPVITPEGAVSTGAFGEQLVPADVEERRLLARRLVAERCLFGVDRNALAVEMAKLSLWLTTMGKGRPFTFVDHALRGGDSLIGITDIAQLEWFHLDPERGRRVHDHPILGDDLAPLRAAVQRAATLRQEIEGFAVNEPADAQRKATLLAEAETATAELRAVADLLVGLGLEAGRSTAALDQLTSRWLPVVSEALTQAGGAYHPEAMAGLREAAWMRLERNGRGRGWRPLHWPLEFPEAFIARGDGVAGFDVVVGNPPFMGGQRITGALGTDYRDHLIAQIARGQKGSADLCAYFLLRNARLVAEGGTVGMIATNTIAEGDTREVGLDQIGARGLSLMRAESSRKWPGPASLQISLLWARRGQWAGERSLDGATVPGIAPSLRIADEAAGKPFRLVANTGRAFIGSYVLGMGFVLTPEEAHELIQRDPRNAEVLFPYLNGEDLNSRPDQSASRWVIHFDELTEEQARAYPDVWCIAEQRAKPERMTKDVCKYPRMVLEWWKHWNNRRELRLAIIGLESVVVLARVTQYIAPATVARSQVLSEQLVVVATDRTGDAGLLQSTVHESWARTYSSRLKTWLRYAPSDCFETFPTPVSTAAVGGTGEAYRTHREAIMLSRQEGLTKTYNRFHNPREHASDIAALRELHVELDRAVSAAYGWPDLSLDHDFRDVPQLGTRLTVSETTRREILSRLLRLNHERHAEEVDAGLVTPAGRPLRRTATRRADSAEDDVQLRLIDA
jgi:hypothetical protein